MSPSNRGQLARFTCLRDPDQLLLGNQLVSFINCYGLLLIFSTWFKLITINSGEPGYGLRVGTVPLPFEPDAADTAVGSNYETAPAFIKSGFFNSALGCVFLREAAL